MRQIAQTDTWKTSQASVYCGGIDVFFTSSRAPPTSSNESVSTTDNVEHLHIPVMTAGNYMRRRRGAA